MGCHQIFVLSQKTSTQDLGSPTLTLTPAKLPPIHPPAKRSVSLFVPSSPSYMFCFYSRNEAGPPFERQVLPPVFVLPHPVTQQLVPVFTLKVSEGRQIGWMLEVKFTGYWSLRRAISFSMVIAVENLGWTMMFLIGITTLVFLRWTFRSPILTLYWIWLWKRRRIASSARDPTKPS